MTKEEKAGREAKARELFAQGLSVNEVAKQVFKNYWAGAKAVKDAMDGIAPKAGKKASAARVEDETEAFDLTVTVSVSSADAIFASFTDAEKASAIQAALQARVDAI